MNKINIANINKHFHNKNVYLYVHCVLILEIIILFFFAKKSVDYDNYTYLIDNIYPYMNFLELLASDPIFSWSTIFLRKLGASTSNIIFLLSSISIVIKNRIFLEYKSSIYIATFYLCSLFWMHELTQIRTGLATTLILLAYHFHNDNKKKWYFSMLLLAAATHISTLIFALLHLIKNVSINYLIALLLMAGLILYFGNRFEDALVLLNIDRISRYNGDDLSFDQLGIFTVVNLLVVFQIYNHFNTNLKDDYYLRLLTPAPFLILFLLIVGQYMPVLSIRFSQILLLPLLLLVSHHISTRNRMYKVLIVLFVVPLLLFAFPYKNFFMSI